MAYVSAKLLQQASWCDILFLNASQNGMKYLAPVVYRIARRAGKKVVMRPFGSSFLEQYQQADDKQQRAYQSTVLQADVLYLQTRQLMAYFEPLARRVEQLSTSRPIPKPEQLRGDRPFEKQDQADRAHRSFAHEDSDFLSLLNLWNALEEKKKNLSHREFRNYCRQQFISFLRVREWREIHSQLNQIVKEFGEIKSTGSNDLYAIIHQCILSGLIGNIAQKESGNYYLATHNRNVMLFPGSCLGFG